ncbi:hypothetical protein [Sphingobium sp. EM0848]|uniref:hypothetical protein n=1 Tax=Sphingobium sp. EM0848 TaxID=2743473 RepID=UPI00159C045C|nr:hypothetical protein [Sphingobium sp. EM0848]
MSEGNEAGVEWALEYRGLDATDGAAGNNILFKGARFQPLDYGTLASARLDQPLTIPIDIHAQVQSTDIEGVEPGHFARTRASLQTPFTSCAIGLVPGGWLPSLIAATFNKAVVLLDRNIVTEVIGRFESGAARRTRQPDFLDLFEGQPITINPILSVLEGELKRSPTSAEIDRDLSQTVAKLRRALPKAILIHSDQTSAGIVQIIDQTRDPMARKQAFLLRMAPLLASPISRKNRDAVRREILIAADHTGVDRNSMVVLAALSIAAVPKARSPAKGLLKFKPGYDAGDAYNALADIRSLEILIKLFAAYPDQPVQFCTADRPLALFWTAIRASNFRDGPDGPTFDMDPVEALMPDQETDWRERLLEALPKALAAS